MLEQLWQRLVGGADSLREINRLERHLASLDPSAEQVISFGSLENAAGFALSQQERAGLEALFGKAGKLRYRDFVRGIRALNGHSETKALAEELRELLLQATAHGIEFRARFEKHDAKKNGVIPSEKFAQALKELGIQVANEALEQMVEPYRENGAVKYDLFLKDLLRKAQENAAGQENRKDVAAAHSDNMDILDKLQEFAYKYMDTHDNRHHEIWMALEKYDKGLNGAISLNQLADAFSSLGYELSNIDKRRIQLRFSSHDGKNNVRYRDLLTTILQAPGVAKHLVPGAAGSVSTSSLGFSGVLQQEQQQHQSKSVVSDEEDFDEENKDDHLAKAPALDRLSKQEMNALLEQLISVQETKPFDTIDPRDLFEQFDFELEGTIEREDFFKCMRWLGFFPDGEQNIRHMHLISRLANRLEVGQGDRVSYRKLFLLLFEYQEEKRKTKVLSLQESEKALHSLVSAVKTKVGSLQVSGLDFSQCFRMHDSGESGAITYRNFHKGLQMIGVDVPIVTLSKALKSLEDHDAPTHNPAEVKVLYHNFLEMIQGVLEKDANETFEMVKKSLKSQAVRFQSSAKQAHVLLNDRYEIVNTLRRFIKEALQLEGKKASVVQSCFEDLDFGGDGLVLLEDLHEGLKLLGVNASENEMKRVMEFSFLCSQPEARNPATLYQDLVARRSTRHYELSFADFVDLIGINKGFDIGLDNVENDLPSSSAVRTQKHLEQPFKLHTFSEIVGKDAIAEVSADKLYANLHELFLKIRNEPNPPTVSVIYESFENYDSDACNLVDEVEAREAFLKTFHLSLSEAEAHQMFRRMDVLVATRTGPVRPQSAGRNNSMDMSIPKSPRIVSARTHKKENAGRPYMSSGLGRVAYRKILRRVFLLMKEEHEDTENAHVDMYVEYLRLHKLLPSMIPQLKALDASKLSRRSAIDLLLPFCEKGVRNPKRLVSELLRRFETDDSQIDISKLSQTLYLELSTDTIERLNLHFSSKNPESRSLLSKFEAADKAYRGVLPSEEFSKIVDGLSSRLHLSSVDVAKLTTRFLVPSLAGSIGADVRGAKVDYRSLFRFFSKQSEKKIASEEVSPQLRSSEMDFQLGAELNIMRSNMMGEFKWAAKKKYDQDPVWKIIWEAPSEQDSKNQDGSSLSLFARMKNKAISFFAWKVRKELYEYTARKVKKLYPKLCEDEKLWMLVGISLAATGLLIKTLCPNAKIPSLEKVFFEWSKENNHLFIKTTKHDGVDVDVMLCYEKDGGNSEQNVEYAARCKLAWRQCEMSVKGTLVQSMLAHGEEYEDPEAKVPESRSPKAKPPNDTQNPDKFFDFSSAPCKALLFELGVQQLLALIEKGKQMKKAKQDMDIAARDLERDATHKYFVQKKNELRFKVPATTDPSDPLLQRMIDFSNGSRSVHATNFVELAKYKVMIKRARHIKKKNFVHAEGEIQDSPLCFEPELTATVRQQGADHHFSLWYERKRAKDQALRLLKYVDPPILMPGTSEDRNQTWKDVCRALKAIEPSGLQNAFLRWSKGFEKKEKCNNLWNSSPPKFSSVDSKKSWVWVHLRTILQKLLSKSEIDYGAAFELVVRGKFNKKDASTKGSTFRTSFTKALACTSFEDFREFLNISGVSLRLNEEKRLVDVFNGEDTNGNRCPNTVSMSKFLRVLGFELNPKAWEQPSIAKMKRYIPVGKVDSGEYYELSIDEKVQRGLQIGGAPFEFCVDWRNQRAALQRSLIFLTVLSRDNRLRKSVELSKAALQQPPPKPYLIHDLSMSSPTELCLRYGIHQKDTEKEDANVLFYTLEQVKSTKEGVGFVSLCNDPEKLTSPPTPMKGELKVTGLSPSTSYEFRVIAFNEHGPSKSTRAIFVTLPVAPAIVNAGTIRCEGKLARCALSWGDKSSKNNFANRPPIAVLPEHAHFGKSSLLGQKVPAITASVTSLGSSHTTSNLRADTTETILKEQTREVVYELLVAQRGYIPHTKGEVGMVIYKGHATICDVVGMKPGLSYEFFVRALNSAGEPGLATPACKVTPLLPPSKPQIICHNGKADSVQVQWKAYDSNSHGVTSGELTRDDAVHGVLADWAETVRKWESNGCGSYALHYEVDFLEAGKKRRDGEVRNRNFTKSLSTELRNLKGNTTYKVRVRMVYTLSPDTESEAINRSPWSSWETFSTPPETPSKPVLVSTSCSSFILRWIPPNGGADSYLVEILAANSPDPEKIWTTQLRTSSTLGVISGLIPETIYRVRIVALGRTGKNRSCPSLPVQHVTLSQEASKLSRPIPSRASVDFSCPCAYRDLILGDMVLFTEKGRLSCYRTIAARVVTMQRDGTGPKQRSVNYWLQVEWCTVSSRDHKNLILPVGARIQRNESEVFRYEVELGVYRMRWEEETLRFSGHVIEVEDEADPVQVVGNED